MTQFGLEYRFGLLLRELETHDQLGFGMILRAHDADHFIEIQIRNEHAIEDVQPSVQLREPVIQAPGDSRLAELQPFQQQLLQAHHTRPAVQCDDVEVYPVIALQIGGGEQVRHQRRRVYAIGFRNDDQPGGVFMIGLIAQVLDHGQLFLLHLRSDLLLYLGAGDLERQRVDHDLTVLKLISRACLETPAAGVVHLH